MRPSLKEPPTPKGLRDEIRRLRAKQESASGDPQNASTASGMSFALRLGADLIAGVTVGSAIGYFLDRWLNTSPIFLLIFLLLGTVAGFMNIYRASQRQGD